MVDHLLGHHHFVLADPPFLWSTYFLVLKVDSLHCATTISGTLLPLFWLRFVLRSLLNWSCNLLVILMSILSRYFEYSGWCSSGCCNEWFLGWSIWEMFCRCQGLQSSNKCSSLSVAYRKYENIKHHAYGQRIREVEYASFTPLVSSATGGLAHEATIYYKCLASLLSTKWGDSYAITLGWLHCYMSFSLLRSAIACISGAWLSSGHFNRTPPPMDLVRVESHLMD